MSPRVHASRFETSDLKAPYALPRLSLVNRLERWRRIEHVSECIAMFAGGFIFGRGTYGWAAAVVGVVALIVSTLAYGRKREAERDLAARDESAASRAAILCTEAGIVAGRKALARELEALPPKEGQPWRN